MIKPIRWPDVEQGGSGKYNSSFQRGERERGLNLTFHLSTLENISQEEANALLVLKGLNGHNALNYLTVRFDDIPSIAPHFLSVESVKALFAGSNDPIPQMRIGHYKPEDEDVLAVTRDSKNQYGQTFFHSVSELGILASHLIGIKDKLNPKVQQMRDNLIIIYSHKEEKRDIFVTTSPDLFNSKDQFIQSANPMTPTETAKLVGLFLRSRNYFTLKTPDGGKVGTNRGAFYWVLMRNMLPSMWRYYSACVMAEDYRKDRTLNLGLSILHRCVRALEARDAIGIGFYNKQNNDIRDLITYHFDYLTLLLAGAFDSMARVARKVYDLTKIKEYSTQLQFRNKDFLKELQFKGANKLVEYASQSTVQALLEIVYNLRNTIHGTNLTPLSYKPQTGREEYSYITLSTELEKVMKEKLQITYDPDTWGLTQFHVLSIEPYTFSTTLINECFKVINRLAAETEITRLFPSNIAVPDLLEAPPENEFLFKNSTRKIISALGD